MSDFLVLHGRFSGYISYERRNGNFYCEVHGVPRGSKLYAINEKDIPVLLTKAYDGKLNGILVTDKNGKVIMEGRAAHAVGSNEKAKLRLPPVKPDTTAKDIKHSAALEEILKRRDDLFIHSEKTEEDSESSQQKAIPAKKHTGFNPFSQTYPNSEWRAVSHKHDRAYHLSGRAYVADQILEITAVPIQFYSERAFLAEGFNKVTRSDDGTVYRMRVRLVRK